MILLSGDSSNIYTANIGSNTISVIERVTNPNGWKQSLIPVGSGPEGFDLTPDGREVWAAHSRDGAVSIIETSTRKVTQTLDLHTKRSNRLRFTPDGRLALISDLDRGELIVLDVATRRVVKRIQVGRSPEGILPAPDGSVAYVAVAGEDQVIVFDLTRLAVSGRMEIAGGPDGMAWVAAK